MQKNTKIYLFGADLIFKEKLKVFCAQNETQNKKIEYKFLKNKEEVLEILQSQSAVESEIGKTIVIFDLKKSQDFLNDLREKIVSFNGETIGYFSHVDSEMAEFGTRSCVKKVVPKSRFLLELERIIYC